MMNVIQIEREAKVEVAKAIKDEMMKKAYIIDRILSTDAYYNCLFSLTGSKFDRFNDLQRRLRVKMLERYNVAGLISKMILDFYK